MTGRANKGVFHFVALGHHPMMVRRAHQPGVAMFRGSLSVGLVEANASTRLSAATRYILTLLLPPTPQR